MNTTHEANETRSKGAEVYSDKAISVVGGILKALGWKSRWKKKKAPERTRIGWFKRWDSTRSLMNKFGQISNSFWLFFLSCLERYIAQNICLPHEDVWALNASCVSGTPCTLCYIFNFQLWSQTQLWCLKQLHASFNPLCIDSISPLA